MKGELLPRNSRFLYRARFQYHLSYINCQQWSSQSLSNRTHMQTQLESSDSQQYSQLLREERQQRQAVQGGKVWNASCGVDENEYR